MKFKDCLDFPIDCRWYLKYRSFSSPFMIVITIGDFLTYNFTFSYGNPQKVLVQLIQNAIFQEFVLNPDKILHRANIIAIVENCISMHTSSYNKK